MILDFCDDSNLDDSSKNIFKQIINKNGEIFSNFITESSQPYHKNLKWWVSLPASRNNFSSELYYNFCIYYETGQALHPQALQDLQPDSITI